MNLSLFYCDTEQFAKKTLGICTWTPLMVLPQTLYCGHALRSRSVALGGQGPELRARTTQVGDLGTIYMMGEF